MFILQFYRFYISLATGLLTYFFLFHSWWVIIIATLCFRTLWYFVEKKIRRFRISRWFKKHSSQFKVLAGPYGIRLINKSETDSSVRESLSEVFTPNLQQLAKTIEQLEVMDTLFKSGLSPDGDTYQLHDLKLKYAKYRIEKKM